MCFHCNGVQVGYGMRTLKVITPPTLRVVPRLCVHLIDAMIFWFLAASSFRFCSSAKKWPSLPATESFALSAF